MKAPAHSAPAAERRRSLRIETPAQKRLLRRLMAMQIAVAFTAGAGTLAALLAIVRSAAGFWTRAGAVAAVAVAVAAVLTYMGARVSNRIAGPAYRIVRSIEARRRGENPGPIRLREGDELQEIADALNAAFHQLVDEAQAEAWRPGAQAEPREER